jgi:alkylhydroperoxidase family enzyme
MLLLTAIHRGGRVLFDAMFMSRHLSAAVRHVSFLQPRRLSSSSKFDEPRIVEYLPSDIKEPAPLVDVIRQRRGGFLLNLDRMLLRSPHFAQGWNSMFGSLRGDKLSVDPKYRELAICTIAVLNKAEYEFYQHEPVWVLTGATPEQIAAIRHVDKSFEEFEELSKECFSDAEKCVILLTIQMTRDVKPSREVLKSMKRHLQDNDAAMVELVAVIAGYNMVSRFLVTLDINAEGEPRR